VRITKTIGVRTEWQKVMGSSQWLGLPTLQHEEPQRKYPVFAVATMKRQTGAFPAQSHAGGVSMRPTPVGRTRWRRRVRGALPSEIVRKPNS